MTTPRLLSRKYIPIILTICMIVLIFLSITPQFSELGNAFVDVFTKIRSEGIRLRIAQYSYALRESTRSLHSILFGYGYQSFDIDFYNEYSSLFDMQSPAGLHNHFLGYLYYAGYPSLGLYALILALAIYWLWGGIKNQGDFARIISLGLLSGLIGSIIILNFTVRLAGYKIIWIISAISALPLGSSNRDQT